MIYSAKQIERFWNNVKLGGQDECWPWQRSTHSNGYGQVGMTVKGIGRLLKAHKVAWEISNDLRIPPGVRASHTCNERLCCNPRHVILSTPDPDEQDEKKKKARGQDHGMSKLTDAQVRTIKYQMVNLTTRQIADFTGVTYHAIWDIRRGKTWAHI